MLLNPIIYIGEKVFLFIYIIIKCIVILSFIYGLSLYLEVQKLTSYINIMVLFGVCLSILLS